MGNSCSSQAAALRAMGGKRDIQRVRVQSVHIADDEDFAIIRAYHCDDDGKIEEAERHRASSWSNTTDDEARERAYSTLSVYEPQHAELDEEPHYDVAEEGFEGAGHEGQEDEEEHRRRHSSAATAASLEEEEAAQEGTYQDRFGYIRRASEAASDVPTPKQLENERVWQDLVVNWQKSNAAIKKRARLGIAHSVRGRVWSLLLKEKTSIPADQMPAYSPKSYTEYKQGSDLSLRWARQIDVDVARQDRDHVLFAERYGHGQCVLFSVLFAYSNYNTELGYCQGMCGMAALLLMQGMTEEGAFWALVHLFSPPYYMDLLYLPGLPRLLEAFYIHDCLVKLRLPDLHAHFEKSGLVTGVFATRWYMTVFIGVLPQETVLRIWDLFVSEGYKCVFNVALALLKLLKGRLLAMDLEEMMLFLQGDNMAKNLNIDPDLLISTSIRKKVKERQILAYQKQYLDMKELEEFQSNKSPQS